MFNTAENTFLLVGWLVDEVSYCLPWGEDPVWALCSSRLHHTIAIPFVHAVSVQCGLNMYPPPATSKLLKTSCWVI